MPSSTLQRRTRVAIFAIVEAALWTLIGDVSRPLLVAITLFGLGALLLAEVADATLIFAAPVRAGRLLCQVAFALLTVIAICGAELLDWQMFSSPLQLEIAQIGLKADSDMHVRMMGYDEPPHGTYAVIVSRIENRGQPDSVKGWKFSATTTSHDSFDAKPAYFGTPIGGPLIGEMSPRKAI